MDKVVVRDEKLYRVVKRSQPDSMREDGKPTSALFKQDDGVSVDRDGSRTEPEIIDAFRARFSKRFKGLVRVGADICIDHDMAVIPADKANEYHAEIFDDENRTPLSSINALILADEAQVVVYDVDVQWTYYKTGKDQDVLMNFEVR